MPNGKKISELKHVSLLPGGVTPLWVTMSCLLFCCWVLGKDPILLNRWGFAGPVYPFITVPTLPDGTTIFMRSVWNALLPGGSWATTPRLDVRMVCGLWVHRQSQSGLCQIVQGNLQFKGGGGKLRNIDKNNILRGRVGLLKFDKPERVAASIF